jgi:Tfp pilus assembly PilM family ATPase
MSVSLYCSATDLRLLVGSANGRQAKIEQFVDAPLPENAMINGIITGQDTMTRFLTEINDANGPFKQDAVLCVESSLIRSRVITVPKVPEQQMLKFVTDELSSSSDPDADDVFDFAVLGPNAAKGGIDVLAIAAGRALLATYIEVFEDAGFKIKRIDVGTNALIKIASYSPHLTDDVDLLALIDGHTLFLVLFDNGRFMLMKKYRLMSEAGTPQWFSEISNNFSALVQFQKTQNSERDIHAVHVVGATEETIAAFKQAVGYLQVPILPLDISDSLRLSGKASFEQNAFQASRFIFNIGTLMGR